MFQRGVALHLQLPNFFKGKENLVKVIKGSPRLIVRHAFGGMLLLFSATS
jgi:hypothetical protein